jgi:hypothetical protein
MPFRKASSLSPRTMVKGFSSAVKTYKVGQLISAESSNKCSRLEREVECETSKVFMFTLKLECNTVRFSSKMSTLEQSFSSTFARSARPFDMALCPLAIDGLQSCVLAYNVSPE